MAEIKYCRFGVKHHIINQSINQSILSKINWSYLTYQQELECHWQLQLKTIVTFECLIIMTEEIIIIYAFEQALLYMKNNSITKNVQKVIMTQGLLRWSRRLDLPKV